MPQDMKEENTMSEVKNVTITVPVGLNGWQQTGSVVINGMKIEFPVGEETQVPETAAALLNELIEAAEKRAEDTAKPDNHYVGAVTIPAGKNLVLEEGAGIKRADKVILPETVINAIINSSGQPDELMLTTPWETEPEAGKTYEVIFNGTAYECKGIAYEFLGAISAVVMGNVDELGVAGGNSDAPFRLVCMPNEVGTAEGAYGMIELTDGSHPYSVTLSIVEKGEAVSGGGGGSGVVFINGTIDPNGDGDETNIWLIPDKNLDECKALIEAGNYLVFKVDNGPDMAMYFPLSEVSGVMRFSAAFAGGCGVVTLNSADSSPQCVMLLYLVD